MAEDELVDHLRRSITLEASRAIGFRPGSWQQRLFGAIFWLPAQRFAGLAAEFDRQIDKHGFSSAVRWLTPRFAQDVAVTGTERIPLDGPLLIVSNHPGAFDGLVIVAQIRRDDIKIIISDVPFTRGMEAASRHMIYSTGDDLQERMSAVRQSLRHLKAGGALMLFPTGLVDPDPSFMPGAEHALGEWSNSLEFFLRQAPQTRLIPVIVSGVIGKKYYDNWLARRQKTVRSRQKVAEYFEIAKLMVVQRNLDLSPRVTFGNPVTLAELTTENQGAGEITEAIISRARLTFQEHQ
jgi:hypothetical protein